MAEKIFVCLHCNNHEVIKRQRERIRELESSLQAMERKVSALLRQSRDDEEACERAKDAAFEWSKKQGEYIEELTVQVQAMETKLREAEQNYDVAHQAWSNTSAQLEFKEKQIAELTTRAQQAEQQKCPDLTVHHWSDFNKTKE